MNKLLLIAAILFISGCQEKPDACWSADSKTSVTSLARKMIQENIEKIVKNSPRQSGQISQEQKKIIADSLSVSIDNYYTKSIDKPLNAFKCGANISIGFTQEKIKYDADDRVMEFEIYPGENGSVYLTNNMVFSQMISDIDGKMAAAKNK